MRIDHAGPSDIPEVEALLVEAGLPLDGAAAAFDSGVVARETGRIVGAPALEPYRHVGLLRSVVVASDRRGTGIGRELVSSVEDLARRSGVEELYLITETAVDWFPRFGYAELPRSAVPAPIAKSVEFTVSCATNGVVMRRKLGLDLQPT